MLTPCSNESLCCQLSRKSFLVRNAPCRHDISHDSPQALDITGYYSKSDITLETIKAMNTQSVDSGFDRGVLLTGTHEFRG